MAYRIIGRDYKAKEPVDKLHGAVCDILCNTAEDLPTLTDIERDNILAGSWAWLANEREYKVLNIDKEWV